MYLQPSPLAKSAAPMRRKKVGPAPGGGGRVLVEFKETPFSRLAPDDLLDTADLCRLFGVSVRTVYRWIAEVNLRPAGKVGRVHLFTKREVLRWSDHDRPPMGRPW